MLHIFYIVILPIYIRYKDNYIYYVYNWMRRLSTLVSKETYTIVTYTSVKRDLHYNWMRRLSTLVSKETYTKETYTSVKRDLH
jgi:hypothetical protein